MASWPTVLFRLGSKALQAGAAQLPFSCKKHKNLYPSCGYILTHINEVAAHLVDSIPFSPKHHPAVGDFLFVLSSLRPGLQATACDRGSFHLHSYGFETESLSAQDGHGVIGKAGARRVRFTLWRCNKRPLRMSLIS